MPTLNRRWTALCVIAAPLLLSGGGCTGKQTEIVNGPVYPDRQQTGVVNIQVIRDSTTVTMTNTTATTFENARLWANQWFSHPLPLWTPGTTLTLNLAEFTDRFGTPMRAGGFFAFDNPEKLVLMQVEQGEALTGLVVIGQAD